MKRPTVRWVPLAVLLLVAAGLAFALLRPTELRAEVLGNAPADSMAVARIDPAALLGSPLWRSLVTERGGDRGLRRLRARCGFDPSAQLDEVMVFVLGGAEARSLEHVVFAARGEFDHESLGECMREVVESQGGGLRRTEVEGLPAVAGRRGDSRIAFLGRGGAIFGLEPAVAQVVRTVRGEPSLLADEEVRRLWDSVAAGADVALVARVPAAWRRLWEGDGGVDDLLSTPMGGLRLVGLGARLGDGSSLRLVLRYRDAERARAVRTWLEERRALVAASAAAGGSVLGRVLREFEVEARGSEVVVEGSLSPDEVEALAAELRALASTP